MRKGQSENMNKLIRQYYRKKELITKETLKYEQPFKTFYTFVYKKVVFGGLIYLIINI